MRLADLVDGIVTAINSAPESNWADLSVGTSLSDKVEAVPAIDPIDFRETPHEGLFIIPVTMEYSRDESQGRRTIVQLAKQPVVSIALCLKYCENSADGVDVSSWDEVKQFLNFREDIDEYILSQDLGVSIQSITAEPAQDILLDTKWYLSVTEIQFGAITCGRG